MTSFILLLTPVLESLFNKVGEAYNLIKRETSAQVFFREYCKMFKNSFCIEHRRVGLVT